MNRWKLALLWFVFAETWSIGTKLIKPSRINWHDIITYIVIMTKLRWFVTVNRWNVSRWLHNDNMPISSASSCSTIVDMPYGLVVKDRDFHPAGPGSIPRGIICLIIIFRFALYKYDFLFCLFVCLFFNIHRHHFLAIICILKNATWHCIIVCYRLLWRWYFNDQRCKMN